MTEFCFKNAAVKSLCHCKQRVKSTLLLSSERVETKLCKPCTSFTSHPHSSCGIVWYRTLRVKALVWINQDKRSMAKAGIKLRSTALEADALPPGQWDGQCWRKQYYLIAGKLWLIALSHCVSTMRFYQMCCTRAGQTTISSSFWAGGCSSTFLSIRWISICLLFGQVEFCSSQCLASCIFPFQRFVIQLD